jgi:hypothetical protein
MKIVILDPSAKVAKFFANATEKANWENVFPNNDNK